MSLIQKIENKIIDRDELRRRMKAWRLKEKRVVFTNGCFDLLHKGHLDLLHKAAEHGQVLVVGVNRDESVKRLKGESRPIVQEDERALMLASLQVVDAVIPFSADTPIEIIKFLLPEVLVKGGDWAIEDIVGAKEVQDAGGEVQIIPLLEGYSSSNRTARIRDLD